MRISMLGLAIAVAAPAGAHDFWIHPAKFATEVGVPVPVTILVGHGAFRQRWGAKPQRVVRFAEIGPAGIIDRRTSLHTDSGDEDATLTFATAGTHVIVLETTHAQSILPAIRFNDYLKTEGLIPATTHRARLKLEASEGREIYSRRAKALVQVGPAADEQPHVTRPVGLTLEIVPQKNPYALKVGEVLPVQIVYQGRPLAGATVKLNNLDFDAKPLAVKLTDAVGRTTFEVPRRGRWQLNVVWTRPIVGNAAADFDTTFSSLTFGFDAPAAAVR